MYVAKTDRTEEIRVQREPAGTLSELFRHYFTKGNRMQTLNREPASGHWDCEQIMAHECCQECVQTTLSVKAEFKPSCKDLLIFQEKL